MKSLARITLIAAMIATSTSPLYGDNWFTDCCTNNLCGSTFALEADFGWRQDQLKYHIDIEQLGGGFDNTSLDIDSINSVQTGARLLWSIPCGVYIRSRLDYANIYGDQDSAQTITNNPSAEFKFKPKFKSGYAYDLLAGIGYQFHVFWDHLIIAPVAGWSCNAIDVKNHNGLIDGQFGVPGAQFAELLKHEVNGRGQGPWVGLDLVFCPTECTSVYAGAEWHWVDYHQKHKDQIEVVATLFPGSDITVLQDGRLNQKANSHAIEVTLGADYVVWDCLSVGLVGHYRYMDGKLRRATREQVQYITESNGDVFPPAIDELSAKSSSIRWQTGDIAIALLYRF